MSPLAAAPPLMPDAMIERLSDLLAAAIVADIRAQRGDVPGASHAPSQTPRAQRIIRAVRLRPARNEGMAPARSA